MTLKIIKIPAVAAVFQEAQTEKSSHTQLIGKLTRIFNQANAEQFTSSFITCLKKVLVSQGDAQYSADRSLEFAVKFVISILGLESAENETPSEELQQFWLELFDFLKESHKIPEIMIRKRVCQFIAKFMLVMSAEAELDCKVCEVIFNIMSERIKDRTPIVRIQAVLAVYRLQDSSDVQCPATNLLLNCIETDNCAEVRKLALTKISLKHKAILRRLIDRVNDVSDKVRKDLYQTFSKLHPQYFSSEERKRLLYTGLYDNSDLVKKVVKNNLLSAWMKRMDDDYMKFLHLFDLIVDSSDLVTKVLMSLFENASAEKNRQTLDAVLDKSHLIPYEKLTCENAFYWRCYVFYSSEMVDEKKNYHWHPEKSYDAMGAGLLPDLSAFCEYIKMYYETVVAEIDPEEKWKRKEKEFIFIQLIELCKVYDYADEVGRKTLQAMCLNLLQQVQIQTVRPLIELFFMLRTNLNASICRVTNEINNLLHPAGNPTEELSSVNEEVTRKASCASPPSRINLTPDREKSFRYKIAQLEVRLEELKYGQEEAIQSEDFAKAQTLKSEIGAIRDQINSLKESVYSGPTSACYDGSEEDNLLLDDTDSEEELANPLENIDGDTVLRCISILYEMLQLSFIKSLTPELRTLLQDFVLHACKSTSHVIAPAAIELLGSFCLRDKELAGEYFITFFSLLGNADICVSTLKVIFDLLLLFGPTAFNISNLDDDNNTEGAGLNNNESSHDGNDSSEEIAKEPEGTVSGYTFISVLIDLLNDEYMEARYTVVHGLCRLMAMGKLKSAKVLSRLIIIWFHPSSREAVEIRDCLNFFFPFFVKRCQWALSVFEEAFVPTMETLFNAPPHNPISEIDQKGVIKVLCEITNPNFVYENEPSDNVHGNLGILICKSIIESDDQENQAVLLKGLDFLNLFSVHPSVLTTLNNLTAKIIRKFKKKNSKKMMTDAQKFKAKLDTLPEPTKDSKLEVKELKEEE